MNVNGKEVDVKQALPLTIGDIRALNREGINVMQSADLQKDVEKIFGFVLYILRKANKDVTDADVDALSMDDLQAVMDEFTERQGAPPDTNF